MPLFLLLIPYVLGILLADMVVVPDWALVVAFLLAVFIVERGKNRVLSMVAVAVAVLGFGYMTTTLLRPTCNIVDGGYVTARVRVKDIPTERDGYRLSHGVIEAWQSDSLSESSNYAVVLWIRNDSIREGDIVELRTKFHSRMSRHEAYDRLLRNRGFVGGVGINTDNVISVERSGRQTLQSRAIRKLERSMRDSMSHATVEAMVVGSRRLESGALRESYSRTGLSHLMALSGLHLGIVVMVLTLLLTPIILIRHGHRWHNVAVIVVLWIYVAMSGGSASLVRSALMFSVMHLAMLSSMRYNSLNALATALFAMLIYRPSYIYDVSFQLSAMAVIGIVVWGVPLMRLVAHRGFILRSLLTTLIIGITATMWTMPIVSHTFANIPYMGVVVTPVAMLTAYAIVCCGIFVLLLPGVLAMPFGWVMEHAAWVQNSFVEWVAQWEWVVVSYQLSGVGVAIIYALFAIITLGVWSLCEKN
ncbi:MAG: ComEC/Rec2 family competence protein [Alistipes sp.]|nr:ComEC/Rec2 family competence protein [Alistipes sp.]